MVKIGDNDAAEKIIALERALGWPEDGEGKRWSEGLKNDLTELRSSGRRILSSEKVFAGDTEIVIRYGAVIYGQGGYDRFVIYSQDDVPAGNTEGEIAFIKFQCTYMDCEEAAKVAMSMGFTVV